MRSLSGTLVLTTTLGSIAVLLSAGVLIYILVRADFFDQVDRSLNEKAQLLATTVEQKDKKIDLEFNELQLQEFEASNRPSYLQLWSSGGEVLFRSPSLQEASLDPITAPSGSPIYRDVKLPNGLSGRAVRITFTPRLEHGENVVGQQPFQRPFHGRREPTVQPITLVLARDIVAVNDALMRLAGLLGLVGLIAIPISAAALRLTIRRGFQPLDRLSEQISLLDEHDLSARIDVPGAPRELQPLIDRLNDLFRQLDGAFQRERAFSADVAHELRTPLAGLQLKMDVALSKPRRPNAYKETIGDCRRIAGQMQAMMENLLAINRLESGQIETEPEQVSPNHLISLCWESLRVLAEERRLEVRWKLGPDRLLFADQTLLRLVIRNILENAVSYVDEEGIVRIETTFSKERAEIHVENSGSPLSQVQAEQSFERFWRGDKARSDAGVHCGLGLSLAQKAVTVLGGAIRVRSTKGGHFEVTIFLPASQKGVGKADDERQRDCPQPTCTRRVSAAGSD